MKADPQFTHLPQHFWANVRLISQETGYTERGKKGERGQIKVPSISEMATALRKSGMEVAHLIDSYEQPTELSNRLYSYFKHRANVLNNFVALQLMDVDRAREIFQELRTQLSPQCPIPMNKQKGNKRTPAYFTAITNMLIEANAEGLPCDYSPRKLTIVTRDDAPLRTLARRIDGAFPNVINPIAVWEIKEYYYTTTFGSRVADAVSSYRTLNRSSVRT